MESGRGIRPRMLTAGLPGIGGRIKAQVDDFRVEEIPLYAPCGNGEHTYFEIEKRDIPTFRAINELARALGIKPQEFGYAGLKDARAVTRQTLSIAHVAPETLMGLNLPHVQVLWAKAHTNKLRIGHLAGNRFVIRVRDVPESALDACRAILDILVQRGVPNYFGEQRFGHRRDTHALGQAIVRDDAEAFLHAFLGNPQAGESPAVHEARRLYEAGDLAAAMRTWPTEFNDERQALHALMRGAGSRAAWQAVRSVPKRMRTFFVSAYQSYLFNLVMDARLETLDRVQDGDVATKHDSGASFLVEDAGVEQPRAERFEISPSGPIYGYKLLFAEGDQGRLEREILAGEGIELEQFKGVEGVKLKGARRSLRFPIQEANSWYDDGVMVQFSLPSGSYATNVMAEITKNDEEMELTE
jgi:tRNA pseudouridine13 synthase